MLEIHQKINNEQDSNTISDTQGFGKQEHSLTEINHQLCKIETPHTPNNTEQNTNTRTKNKSKKFKENPEWTTLPILRNIEWRTIKMETEKNKSSINIYTNKT